MWLRNRGALPDSVRVSGPVLTLRTLRGRAFLDRLAAPKRLWRAVANLGLGGALVAMVGSFILILSSALSAIRTVQPSAIQQPQNFLIIPGVNDFLPCRSHPDRRRARGRDGRPRGAHGLLCRVVEGSTSSRWGSSSSRSSPSAPSSSRTRRRPRRSPAAPRARMFAAASPRTRSSRSSSSRCFFGPVVGAIAPAPGYAAGEVTESRGRSGRYRARRPVGRGRGDAGRHRGRVRGRDRRRRRDGERHGRRR